MLRLRLVGEIAAEVDGEGRPLPPGRPRALLGGSRSVPAPSRERPSPPSSGPTFSTTAPARACGVRSGRCAARSARRRSSRLATASASRPTRGSTSSRPSASAPKGDADEALALLDGAFLPGLDEEWALEAQDEHRDRLVSLLEELASAAARDGDLRRAVALTRRQAALEPLSEEIHRALDAPARRSRRPGRRARRVHRAPQPARHPAPDGAVAARRSSSPTRSAKESPLRRRPRSRCACSAPTGRRSSAASAELARIDAAWRRVTTGGGAAQVVLLAGEAGIGKSRITARFAAEASAAGATVLYGACEEQSLVPYAPFSEAIGGKAPEREEIEASLTSAAESGPLLLALDDLHLADRNTLALLARVARGAAGDRLLVLGAYRDADAVGTPLLAAIADLRRDCDVERVAVEGLSVDEVEALLDGTADARRIHDRTDGNPFFVRELARHLAERRDGAGGVPESVSDVVLARVARLSPERRRDAATRVRARRVVRPLRARALRRAGRRARRPRRGGGGRTARGRRRRPLPLRTCPDPGRRLRRHRREPPLGPPSPCRRRARARPRPRARAGAGRDRRPPLRSAPTQPTASGRSSWPSRPRPGRASGTRGSRS